MTKTNRGAADEVRTLSTGEIEQVAGGMVIQKGYRSANVEDTRGGIISLFGGAIQIAVGGDGSLGVL